MKYIVGASIGGLFGLSVPFVFDGQIVDNDNEIPRIEDSQPVEDKPPRPIDMSLTLPDNTCGYIQYDTEDLREQAKQCLSVDLPAMPAI
jgi:hypothetical protein